MRLAYHGKHYHGWQIQPNAETIQGLINHALSLLLSEAINVVGAGRTDTGVHARVFYAHFDYHKDLDSDACNQLQFKLNNFLPNDIAVYEIFAVHPKAHARFDALSRTYKYYVALSKDPFACDTSYFYFGNLDVKRMNEAAGILFSYSDFTSFAKVNTDTKTNLCDIHTAEWREEKGKLVFTIKANRFLRNMVRAVVGTLLDIGQHKLSVLDMHRIIQHNDRSAAGFSVPARGLFLHDIEYPVEIFRQQMPKQSFDHE
jgi:tRNA pseudouridine38-40 synthase